MAIGGAHTALFHLRAYSPPREAALEQKRRVEEFLGRITVIKLQHDDVSFAAVDAGMASKVVDKSLADLVSDRDVSFSRFRAVIGRIARGVIANLRSTARPAIRMRAS